jgi:hypothetical protein
MTFWLDAGCLWERDQWRVLSPRKLPILTEHQCGTRIATHHVEQLPIPAMVNTGFPDKPPF